MRYGGRADSELVVVLDCSDLEQAATFWCSALGYRRQGAASGRYCSLLPAGAEGFELLLQQTSDLKVSKNRMHLDLRVRDLQAEVDRLIGLGARQITDRPIEEDGWAWHILADVDGNELCVLRPPESHWAS